MIRVTRDRVQLENGHESIREVVHHHGGAAVAALNEKGEIYLVRQYRYALDRELIEIPAGKLEKGEDPFAAARRELGEGGRPERGRVPRPRAHHPHMRLLQRDHLDVRCKRPAPRGDSTSTRTSFCRCSRCLSTRRHAWPLSGEITDSKTVVAILKLKALRDAGEF